MNNHLAIQTLSVGDIEYIYRLIDQSLYDTATCPHFILQSLRDSILRKSSN